MAETLFQDGKQLMETGSTVEACPKLARSHQLDPGGGTVLLLAMCYERSGKVASAWLRFHDALGYARRDGREDRAQRAREHLEALAPRLSRIGLELPREVVDAKGGKLRLDDSELPAETVHWSLPVDPGPHRLEVSAPGKRPWRTTFVVEGDGQEVKIIVPTLASAPDARKSTATEHPPLRPAAPLVVERTSSSPWRTAGFVIGSAGLVSLGIGAYFGVSALSHMSDARHGCSSAPSCTDAAAVRASQEASSAALRADVLLGAGLVAVAGGVILISTSPGRSERTAVLSWVPRAQGGTVQAAAIF